MGFTGAHMIYTLDVFILALYLLSHECALLKYTHKTASEKREMVGTAQEVERKEIKQNLERNEKLQKQQRKEIRQNLERNENGRTAKKGGNIKKGMDLIDQENKKRWEE